MATSDRKGREGASPIGANLRASVRVEHTGEASSPLHDGAVPIDVRLPRLRPPPRLRFLILDRLSVRAYGGKPHKRELRGTRLDAMLVLKRWNVTSYMMVSGNGTVCR